MEKFTLTNRKGQRLAAIHGGSEHPDKLIFLVPGLGGNMNEEHLKVARQVFGKLGFGVVTFDPANTGGSEGRYQDITATGYLEDLEDVIVWAQNQPWFREPFYLSGHSLGGLTVGAYAEENPEKVAGLVLLSSVISGKLSCETDFYKDKIAAWQNTGNLINDVGETLPWSHMADRLKFDLVFNASKLTMPVLQVVGSLDRNCPIEHQRLLFEAIPGTRKELLVVEGAEHCFEDKLAEFEETLGKGTKELVQNA